MDKVESVRQITGKNVNVELSIAPAHSAVQSEPVSLASLTEVVQHMMPTNCLLDIVPAKVLKEDFNTVGPGLLVFYRHLPQFKICPSCL